MRKLQLLSSVLVLAAFASPAAAKVKVAATLPSLAALARDVGGSLVDVVSLASPQQDPHYVDPRPSFVIQLASADLLLLNGLELEQSWLAPILLQSRNPKIQPGSAGYFDASAFVARLEIPAAGVDRSQGDVHPGGNPHYLYDPRQAERVTLALGRRLAQLDPDNAAAYQARAKDVAHRLHTFADEQHERFEALPAQKRLVVSYHRSLVYLYDWLGLTEVTTVEPRPGIPPDPGHVAQVLKTMKERKTSVIVQEEFYPTSTSRTLARLSQGAVVSLDGGARFDDGQTYLDHLKVNAERLYAALSR